MRSLTGLLVTVIFTAAIAMSALGFLAPQATAGAVDFLPPEAAELEKDGTLGVLVKNIINTALSVLGGLSVIMVIVGGIRLASAHGDPSQVKAGRETILYSLVGLIVAIAAGAIVNFVVSFNW